MNKYANAKKPIVFALFHFYQRLKLEESATDSSDESGREGTASVTENPTDGSSDDEVPSIPPSGVVSTFDEGEGGECGQTNVEWSYSPDFVWC